MSDTREKTLEVVNKMLKKERDDLVKYERRVMDLVEADNLSVETLESKNDELRMSMKSYMTALSFKEFIENGHNYKPEEAVELAANLFLQALESYRQSVTREDYDSTYISEVLSHIGFSYQF